MKHIVYKTPSISFSYFAFFEWENYDHLSINHILVVKTTDYKYLLLYSKFISRVAKFAVHMLYFTNSILGRFDSMK